MSRGKMKHVFPHCINAKSQCGEFPNFFQHYYHLWFVRVPYVKNARNVSISGNRFSQKRVPADPRSAQKKLCSGVFALFFWYLKHYAVKSIFHNFKTKKVVGIRKMDILKMSILDFLKVKFILIFFLRFIRM